MVNDEGISAGVVSVDVVPNTSRFAERARRDLETPAAQLGRRIGERIGDSIVAKAAPALARAIRDGGKLAVVEAGKVGRDAGARFGQAFRAEVERRRVSPRIDVDTAGANRKLDVVLGKVDRLSGARAQIAADADTGAAMTNLTAVDQLARRVGRLRPTIDVDADTGAATAKLAAVGTAASTSGRGISGLLVAAALIAPVIVPAAAAAVVALAAIGPAAAIGAAGIGVAILGFSGVGDAVKAMGEAQKKSGQDAAQAASRQASLASAAEGVRDAAQRVTDAQRDLTRAERDALDVRRELSQAQREAREAMEDLNSQVRSNALEQRQGNLDIAAAKRELDKVLTDPKATRDQTEQAKIRYQREVLQQEDLRRRGQRLRTEQAETTKAGINGSKQVVAVRQRIVQADERVLQAQRQLRAAQQASIAAQRQLRVAAVTTGAAGSSAMDKLRDSMAALSPAGQRFATFLFGLRGSLRRVRDAAQGGLLPGVEAGIRALLPVLPQVEVFVGRVATALGGFFAAFGKAMASPFWQRFFDQMGLLAGPMFETLAVILDGLGRGFASLLLAFAPVSAKMGDGLAKMAQGFADWAASLAESQGFKDFIAYVVINGPKLLDTLVDVVDALIHIGKALAPIGDVGLAALRGLSSAILAIPTNVLTTILGVIIGVIAVTKTWAIVQGVLNVVMALNPLGLVVIAVLALAAAVVVAWRHSETFRDIVKGAWEGIAAAAKVAWEQVIRPILLGLRELFVEVVAPAALWLWRQVLEPAFRNIGISAAWAWEHAIRPALTALWAFITKVLVPALLWWWRNVTIPVFQAIGAAISFWWTRIVQPVLAAVRAFVVNVLAPVFLWLWRNVVVPAFNGIRFAVQVAWTAIRIVFGLILIWVKVFVAPVFGFLWDAVKVAWGGISSTIKLVWNKGIKPVLQALAGFIGEHVVPAFKTAVTAIGAAWSRIQELASVPVRFVIDEVINKGIIDTYNKIAKFFGVPTVPRVVWGPKAPQRATRSGLQEFADGGIYPGYTPGRDVGLAKVSGGEAFMRPEWTRAVGPGYVHAANAAARAGGVAGVRRMLARPSGDGIGDLLTTARDKATDAFTGVRDLLSNPTKALQTLIDRLIALVPNRATAFAQAATASPRKLLGGALEKIRSFFAGGQDGGAGVTGGGLGWERMMGILRALFPGLALFSGFRRNSVTSSGNRSWHAVGRAVDVPPRSDVFDFIYRNFFPGTRELIWLGAANRNIRNGQHFRYSDALLRQHGVAGMPNAHIHWAYDQGGYLPPGISTVYNGTGRPEPVLTDQQWQVMQAATRGADSPREVHHWQFANTTMTPARLQSWQDRRDALARVNRPH